MSSEDRVIDLYRCYYASREWKMNDIANRIKNSLNSLIISRIAKILE